MARGLASTLPCLCRTGSSYTDPSCLPTRRHSLLLEHCTPVVGAASCQTEQRMAILRVRELGWRYLRQDSIQTWAFTRHGFIHYLFVDLESQLCMFLIECGWTRWRSSAEDGRTTFVRETVGQSACRGDALQRIKSTEVVLRYPSRVRSKQ